MPVPRFRLRRPIPRTTLGARDLHAVLDAALELAPATTLADLPAIAGRAMRRLVPADAYGFNDVDPESGRMLFLVDPPDLVQSGLAERWLSLAHEHPLITHHCDTGDRGVHKISDFLTRAEFRATGMYRDVYRDMGIEFQISVTVAGPQPHVVALVLTRTHRDFTERERALLMALQPHLHHAYRRAQATTRLYLAVQSLGWAVDSDGRGVALVDAAGRFTAVSPLAARWLAEHTGATPAAGDPLPAPLAAWIRSRHGAAADDGGESLALDRDGRRLVVGLVPRADGPDVLLLEERPATGPLGALMGLDLTEREAQVLLMVRDGRPNAEIAAALGVTVATARKHVEHVLAKLGVRNRTEAAAVAFRTLAAQRGAAAVSPATPGAPGSRRPPGPGPAARSAAPGARSRR